VPIISILTELPNTPALSNMAVLLDEPTILDPSLEGK
jgi:hypothetical protein